MVADEQNHRCPLQLQGQRSPPAATPVPEGEADKLARTEVGATVGPQETTCPERLPSPAAPLAVSMKRAERGNVSRQNKCMLRDCLVRSGAAFLEPQLQGGRKRLVISSQAAAIFNSILRLPPAEPLLPLLTDENIRVRPG